ncbi:MAG: hypothetical protein AB7F19_05435 [Candidatus Babeliales bacterium]
MNIKVAYALSLFTISFCKSENIPFGMFFHSREEVNVADSASFKAFDTPHEQEIIKITQQQQQIQEAQEIEKHAAQLRTILEKREEKRTVRYAHFQNAMSVRSYKLSNRELLAKRAAMPEPDITALYRTTLPDYTVLCAQRQADERANRSERVQAYADQQAEVLLQAINVQHTIKDLCADIERLQATRYAKNVVS